MESKIDRAARFVCFLSISTLVEGEIKGFNEFKYAQLLANYYNLYKNFKIRGAKFEDCYCNRKSWKN